MSQSASGGHARSRPVILTVDDEPEVLSAVERDLRRHFRSDYRVVKAGSGSQALDATLALKERDAPVALFLADERMPRMTGTEFLREARSIFPDARKVLLTAYADTRAAITGINDVGLDYYLMKPWDPPEEHLYPVLDELLEAWSASYRPPFRGIRVLGTAWSPESHAVRDFLTRHQRPYQWIDIELDAEAARWVEEVAPGRCRLPVVAFPDGPPLVAPSPLELGERIGLQVHATLPLYDVVIAGAGPSGLAAAVYASSEGLRTLVVERDAPGGQAGTSSMIENYPGFPAGIGGAELARRASFQAQRFGSEIVSPQEITALRVDGPTKVVTLADGSEISARALVAATGMKVRQLDVPGLDAWTGAGVYYGAAISEAASCSGHDVVVVGGANSAGQAALLLSRYAGNVTMVVRGPSLSATMSRYLVDRIEASDTIEVLVSTRIVAARGDRSLEALVVREDTGGTEREIETQYLFIFVGSMPHSEFLAGIVMRDERGFVLTGPDLRTEGRLPKDWSLERDPFLLETSVPGIFAVGDVRHGSTKRVASAVGEGSAAIGSVHRYLEEA